MRVLYIISGTEWGGATISLLTLLKGIKPLGVEAFVFMHNRNEEFVRELEGLNVKYWVESIRFFCYPSVDNVKDFLLFPKRILGICKNNYLVSREIIKIVKEEHIDIIHTNVGPIRIGHFVSTALSIPHVWHIREYGDRDFSFKEMPSRAYFRRLLRKSYVITITNDLAKYNKLADSKTAATVYDGVMSQNSPAPAMQKEKYFLCCSRISPEKGHLDVVNTFSKFVTILPEYKLVILGDGDKNFIEKLKKVADNNNCGNSVIFPGFKRDVRDYISKAQALIVASPSEGFGMMTAEAAFLGCAIIGRNTAGTREILDKTGGFPFLSNEELLQSMINVAQLSKEEYGRIVKHARNIAENLYSSEQYARNVYRVYVNAIAGMPLNKQ